ncbi:MAG TPA: GNAT family protein [Bryobacteraceae bacterium]|nr:GNAT family protein [Bryobacteraceae bacterium]
MPALNVILTGRHVRLEPLDFSHAPALVAAATADLSLYRWTPVPRDEASAKRYIETVLAWRDAGTAMPFATVRIADNVLIGSTRFWNMERFNWPEGHERYGVRFDGCEIGWTWLTRSAIRTGANTEAKLLMMTQAFECWQMLRVCLHTDARNERSRAAIERIGGRFEGILRAHRMAADFVPRDSARYSILAAEWPDVKRRLSERLER